MSESTNRDLRFAFILGAGRSGTKFLRDTLAASNEVAVVPYDVGYVWRYGNEDVPHDELTVDMLTDEIRSYIRKTLPKLCVPKYCPNNTRLIIEKSVPNALRPEFVHSVFPEALFIHLYRDGRAVSESSVRQWSMSPERGYLLKKLRFFPWSNYKYAIWYMKNIFAGIVSGRGQNTWGPRYKGIDEDIKTLPLDVVCARQWRKCVENSQQQLVSIDESRSLGVRYEDLMASDEVLSKICGFLGISDTEKVLEMYVSTRISSNTEKWKSRLSPESLTLILEEVHDPITT